MSDPVVLRTVPEVAERLRVSRRTVERLIANPGLGTRLLSGPFLSTNRTGVHTHGTSRSTLTRHDRVYARVERS